MKKLSFLLGSVGGAMAGYVLSNKKLRAELSETKDATEAAKILGKHLAKDGQTVAKEVGQLAEQYHLDDRVAEGKEYVANYYRSAKGEAQRFLSKKVKQATNAVKGRKKSATTTKKK